MGSFNMLQLRLLINQLRGDSPTLQCLEEAVVRDAHGIDPFEELETSLDLIADGDRLAQYLQACYLMELARVYPSEASRLLRRMSHLKSVANWLLLPTPEVPDVTSPATDAELLKQVAEASLDVGA